MEGEFFFLVGGWWWWCRDGVETGRYDQGEGGSRNLCGWVLLGIAVTVSRKISLRRWIALIIECTIFNIECTIFN